MTANPTRPPQSAAPINVLLLMTEHLPHRHQEALREIAHHEEKIRDLRAEVSRLEKHAAIEGLALNHPTDDTTETEP